MEIKRIISILESMPLAERTLISRKKRLEEDIILMRAKMAGQSINYQRLNIIDSNQSSTNLEDYTDRIIAMEKEIESIKKSLSDIDLVRDTVYNLQPFEQSLIVAKYYENKSSSQIARSLFLTRDTINRKLKIAIENLYDYLESYK